MLTLIDRLAGKWLDWRLERAVANNTELQEFGLKKAEYREGSFEIVAVAPMVCNMADEAARILEEGNARNYIQMDMMPRLDRGMRPVRITLQWAFGMSPATKAAMLEDKLAEVRALLPAESPEPAIPALEL